jgi:hypothetical protein
MKKTCSKNKKLGVSLVEIVIGSAVLTSVFFAAAGAVNQIRFLERETTHIIRANYLLLEGIDVVKIFRDTGWSSEIATLSLNTPYYLLWDSGAWTSTTTEIAIDGVFYRTVELDSVERDGNDNIADSGTLDPGTLELTSTVSWLGSSGTTTRSFETYITNLYAN